MGEEKLHKANNLQSLSQSLEVEHDAPGLFPNNGVRGYMVKDTGLELNNDLMGPTTSLGARSSKPDNLRQHSSLASTIESFSDRDSSESENSIDASKGNSSSANHYLYLEKLSRYCSNDFGISSLNSRWALLRREMYKLRQLDISLLSQLWALNESIQGIRAFLQDQEMSSPLSPSSGSDTNIDSSEDSTETHEKLPFGQNLHHMQDMEMRKYLATLSSNSGSLLDSPSNQ